LTHFSDFGFNKSHYLLSSIHFLRDHVIVAYNHLESYLLLEVNKIQKLLFLQLNAWLVRLNRYLGQGHHLFI